MFQRPLWILFAGTFINRCGMFVLPFLAIYLTRHGYSAAQAGIAISAYGGGHLIAAMLGGHLADRIGRRNTIVLSMFLSASAMLALSQARTYPAILAFTLIAGSAAEMYRPAASALIGDLTTPDQRVTAFALFRFALNLGFAAGPAMAGFLADRSFLYLFIGDAATSFVFGVIALLALPHGLRSHAQQERDGGAIDDALHNRAFVTFIAATLCITWIEYQISTTFPLYVQSIGFSPKTYGLLISLNGILIALFELALTTMTRRFAPQPIIALGYALFAIGYALTGMAHAIPSLVLAVVVWTIGEMTFAPVTGAYVTNLAPERFRGRYHGIYTLTWSLGILFGPTLGMLLFQRNASAYWMTVACAGIAGASLALLRPRGAYC
jgi:MFS family permease